MAPSGVPPNPSFDGLKIKLQKVLILNGITAPVSEIVIIEPPELKGEHFATETVYAKVIFKDPQIKPRNLFVKKFSGNNFHTEWVKDMKVMDKESSFFNEVLPNLRNFCKKYPGCENLLHFFPKCIFGDDEIVVLENVVLDYGYTMLDKEEFQDLYTTKMVVTNLATFHATNWSFIQEMGIESFMEKYKLNIVESFDCSENSKMAPMFDNGIGTCISILTNHPVPGASETIRKLGLMIGKVAPEMATLLIRDPDSPLLVLNHGDCWNNNMLFKKDQSTGLVTEHVFVDLQITRFGSPCIDLGYFLFTSVKPEVRRAHLQEILKTYYNQFEATARKFGRNCPITFEKLFEDFKIYSKVGYIFSLTMLTAIGAMKDMDMNDFETDMDKLMEKFAQMIKDWVDANPTTCEKIGLTLVDVVREFEDLQAK